MIPKYKKHASLWLDFNTQFDEMHSRPRDRGRVTVANFIKDAFRRTDAVSGIYTCVEPCLAVFWRELYNKDNSKHPFNVDQRSYRLHPTSYNLLYDGLQATLIILRLISAKKLNANPIHPSLLDSNYIPICVPNKNRRLGYEIIIGVVTEVSYKDFSLDVNEPRSAESSDLIYCLGRSEPIIAENFRSDYHNVPTKWNSSLVFSTPTPIDTLQVTLQRYMLMTTSAPIENDMTEERGRFNIGFFIPPHTPPEQAISSPADPSLIKNIHSQNP